MSAALRFGFEREGTIVADVDDAEGLQESIDKGSQLIITGGESKDDADQKLAMIEGVLACTASRVRVLYFGNDISRNEAIRGGAHEFLNPPAFIRDVVTLSKLMATPMERRTQSISGELSEHFGLYYLVRALGMVRYTGVLTLLRGLRRGELRFYDGEVTSGQMGSLHGLAALHQSLLWTHARFDLRDEQTVHRQQIPLERLELLRDCERFLSEIRSVAGGLSPSAVLDRDSEKESGNLPEGVVHVLELFNGTSSIADIIQDSPYRVFETLRIACRLAEQGFVRRASKEAPKHLMHTALAIEEWLVSGEIEAEDATEEGLPVGPAKGQPASPPQKGRAKKKRGARNKSESPLPPSIAGQLRHEQSWSDLLPTLQANSDMAQVVPSTEAAGEISVNESRPSSRASRVGGTEPPPMPERERLEEKGGVDSLSKIFVDQSLGAEEVPTKKDDSAVPKTRDKNSWEEITSPAMPQPYTQEDNATSKAASAASAASEEAVSATSESAPEGHAKAAPEAAAKAASTSEPIPAKYDEAAMRIVAATAKDAAGAIREVLQAATADPSLFMPPKRTGRTRADSKSEQDAQSVTNLASAAEAAGTVASHFSAEEEAFFDRGQAQAKAPPVVVESFEDLDEDYEIPKTFWKRFMSSPDMRNRKKKK